MTGNCRVPRASNSSSAPSSARTLRDRNGIWCLPRNSLVRKQLVQPGCQYTLIGSSDGAVELVMILTVVVGRTLTLPLTRNNQSGRRGRRLCACASAIEPKLPAAVPPDRRGATFARACGCRRACAGLPSAGFGAKQPARNKPSWRARVCAAQRCASKSITQRNEAAHKRATTTQQSLRLNWHLSTPGLPWDATRYGIVTFAGGKLGRAAPRSALVVASMRRSAGVRLHSLCPVALPD